MKQGIPLNGRVVTYTRPLQFSEISLFFRLLGGLTDILRQTQ